MQEKLSVRRGGLCSSKIRIRTGCGCSIDLWEVHTLFTRFSYLHAASGLGHILYFSLSVQITNGRMCNYDKHFFCTMLFNSAFPGLVHHFVHSTHYGLPYFSGWRLGISMRLEVDVMLLFLLLWLLLFLFFLFYVLFGRLKDTVGAYGDVEARHGKHSFSQLSLFFVSFCYIWSK